MNSAVTARRRLPASFAKNSEPPTSTITTTPWSVFLIDYILPFYSRKIRIEIVKIIKIND
jgi:hypothetical protein